MTTIGEIRIDATRFNNPSLPLVSDMALAIADDPRVAFFGSLVAGKYTSGAGGSYDGLISALANRKTGSPVTLTEAVTTAQPSLDLDYGPSGRGAMRVLPSGTDKLTCSTAFPVAGDHFKVAIFRADSVTNSQYLLYSGVTGNRHLFGPVTTNGGSIRQAVGAAGTEATISVVFPLAQWNLVIGCWNAANKQVALSINNGAFQTNKNVAAVLDEIGAIMTVASGAEFAVSDIGWGTCDLTLDANADLLDKIIAYARDICGLNV